MSAERISALIAAVVCVAERRGAADLHARAAAVVARGQEGRQR